MEKPDLLKPALISGIIFGVASSLPIVTFLNCLCCSLVFACGIFGSFLLMRQTSGELTYRQGASVGILAGLFGAFSVTIVNALIQITIGKQMKEMAVSLLENLQSKMPPNITENFEFIEKQIQQDFTVVDMIMVFFLWLIIFAIFSTLGGILGVALFGRRRKEHPQYPQEQSPL